MAHIMTHPTRRASHRVRPISLLSHLYGVWRERQALRHLDGNRLNDIGLTRDEALKEARRALWDAPSPWRD